MKVIVTTKKNVKTYKNIYSVTEDNSNFVLTYLWNQKSAVLIPKNKYPHIICLNGDC